MGVSWKTLLHIEQIGQLSYYNLSYSYLIMQKPQKYLVSFYITHQCKEWEPVGDVIVELHPCEGFDQSDAPMALKDAVAQWINSKNPKLYRLEGDPINLQYNLNSIVIINFWPVSGIVSQDNTFVYHAHLN